MIIRNSFASENYKQLQKSINIQNWGGKFLKVGEIGVKQILKQRFSFRKIPTNNYVAITPLQNVKKNISEPLLFKRGAEAKVITFA